MMELCSICYGSARNLFITTCGHSFHHECLDEWAKIQNIFPCCRRVGVLPSLLKAIEMDNVEMLKECRPEDPSRPIMLSYTWYHPGNRLPFFTITPVELAVKCNSLSVLVALIDSWKQPIVLSGPDQYRIFSLASGSKITMHYLLLKLRDSHEIDYYRLYIDAFKGLGTSQAAWDLYNWHLSWESPDRLLVASIYTEDSTLFAMCLFQDADINATDAMTGRTAIDIASDCTQLTLFRELFDRGADLVKPCKDLDFIHRVVRRRDSDMINSRVLGSLIDAASVARLDETTKECPNVMMQLASHRDFQKFVRQLLAKGADPNTRYYDKTALTFAMEHGQVDAARLLFSAMDSRHVTSYDATIATVFSIDLFQ